VYDTGVRLAWQGRIAAAGAPGVIPALDNATSMVIRAIDLALFVPLCILAGVLLLRRRVWGLLLDSVGVLKFLNIGLAVSLMGLNMPRVAAASSVVEWVVFPAIALAALVMAVALLTEKSIQSRTIELAISTAQVRSSRVARAELSNQALEPSHHSLLSSVARMDVAPRCSPASVHQFDRPPVFVIISSHKLTIRRGNP
jgi:hypothetical protein